MAISLLFRQSQDNQLPLTLQRLTGEYGVDACRLEFEPTGITVMRHSDQVL